ncbi:hypothetical protein P691DRAFT_300692 [Macrolepiota fuliginosa MF-IS2]|uniref:Uncharacterized protein n=1 Tax=Macrolepiota fuliginosa MF-IS2 TaxID=1400762 RepID=A0A9P5XJ21_9AGAR|nr:hypothetical protein P691DRAFT_300692 [Macrolepiota fuliginosa MF-IS2]
MHHVNNCDQFPPSPGDLLQLPAKGVFTVEHAANRAFTTLSFDGNNIATYPDGQDHPGLGDSGDCISEPNIHTTNESMAAGTAFAISYTSNLSEVQPDNLVVFSVLYNTPWRRLATYSVPQLPPCPVGGCICVWGWVPNGCGEPNMYMQPLRCNVTGRTGTTNLAKPNPPAWCEGDTSTCTKGAKQMIYWNQQEGNNIVVSGTDNSGMNKSPGYNMKLGFTNGPQNDIFGGTNVTAPPPSPSRSSVSRELRKPAYQYIVLRFLFMATLIVGLSW